MKDCNKAILSGNFEFQVLSPDIIFDELILNEILSKPERRGDTQYFQLPEKVSIAEYDIEDIFALYEMFGEEHGGSLTTNINKRGLKEGDIIRVNGTTRARRSEEMKVCKSVYLLILSNNRINEIIEKQGDSAMTHTISKRSRCGFIRVM